MNLNKLYVCLLFFPIEANSKWRRQLRLHSTWTIWQPELNNGLWLLELFFSLSFSEKSHCHHAIFSPRSVEKPLLEFCNYSSWLGDYHFPGPNDFNALHEFIYIIHNNKRGSIIDISNE